MSDLVVVRMIPGPGRETAGDWLRVSRAVGERWVAEGIAEYAPETAMAAPPENAMLPRGRARKVERR